MIHKHFNHSNILFSDLVWPSSSFKIAVSPPLIFGSVHILWTTRAFKIWTSHSTASRKHCMEDTYFSAHMSDFPREHVRHAESWAPSHTYWTRICNLTCPVSGRHTKCEKCSVSGLGLGANCPTSEWLQFPEVHILSALGWPPLVVVEYKLLWTFIFHLLRST